MPVRKPRRDPKTTASAFEALFFPELIDRVFDSAPYESLLVLRGVCQSWKYRADCHLVRRVIVKTGPRHSQWTASTPYGPIPRPNWHNTKIARHVAHVDIVKHFPPAWVSKLPRLRSMRQAAGRSDPVTSLYPSCPDKELATWLSSDLSAHAVICFQTTTILHFPVLLLPPRSIYLPKSLTIIACGLPSTAGENDAGSQGVSGGSFSSLLHVVGTHLSQAYKKSVSAPITFVNLTAWYDIFVRRPHEIYPHLFHNSSFIIKPSGPTSGEHWACRSNKDFCDLIREQLCLVNVPQQHHSELLGTISFISLQDYRDTVGDDRVRFETELLFTDTPNNADGDESDGTTNE